MVGFILATAVAVALAEIYSDIIGTETRTHARVERARSASIAEESARGRLRDRLPGGLLPARVRGRDRDRHGLHDREVVRARR